MYTNYKLNFLNINDAYVLSPKHVINKDEDYFFFSENNPKL